MERWVFEEKMERWDLEGFGYGGGVGIRVEKEMLLDEGEDIGIDEVRRIGVKI